jgi:hypothetical protein
MPRETAAEGGRRNKEAYGSGGLKAVSTNLVMALKLAGREKGFAHQILVKT